MFLFTSILVDHRVEVTDTPVDRKNLWKVSAAVKNTFEPLSKVRQHVYNCKHFIYHLTKILRKWAMNTARLPLITIPVEPGAVLNKGWWPFLLSFIYFFSSNDFFYLYSPIPYNQEKDWVEVQCVVSIFQSKETCRPILLFNQKLMLDYVCYTVCIIYYLTITIYKNFGWDPGLVCSTVQNKVGVERPGSKWEHQWSVTLFLYHQVAEVL